MSFLAVLSASFFIFRYIIAQNFSLYPTVDPVQLASAFNISIDCLDALNTTLPCDNTLLQMAGSVDNYYWQTDNLTALCTNDCYSAVQDWSNDVQVSCYYDTIVAYNTLVPANSVSGRFVDGLGIACLTNLNATTDLDFSFCLIESQDWVGSDIVRPDCSVDPSDPSCSDPTNVSPENERIANLYGDAVLCSECFVQMMYQRVSSQYLPDLSYSDYLIEQYQDIIDVCNANDHMPEIIIRAPPDYIPAVPVPLNFSDVPPPDTSCTGGQFIVPSTLDPNANCATISQAFNVATGTVQFVTNSTVCKSTTNYCLPAPCSLHQVAGGETCDSLAVSFSTVNLTVSTMQLLTWNPNINGLCDSLTPDDNICSSPPGGSYVPPPPPPGSASDNNQQRGGGDGSSTSGNSTLLCTQQEAPAPVQDGISSACTQWCQAMTGDFCFNFAQETNITTDGLYKLNPVLGTGGSSCETQFQAGYWYCVAGPGVTPTSPSITVTSTTRPVSTSTAPAVPSPTQSGIVPNCNKYQIATPGDFCFQFAQENNITPDQLYAWNTILGSGGADCSTMFQAGYYYCVGTSS